MLSLLITNPVFNFNFLDITPTGSLRRRRSRVLSEDDEGNLMEFLRTSGNDTNRERKSWGSLGKKNSKNIFKNCILQNFIDRSWARKARGSGPRKRPALLGADFSLDRERPSSPSPLSENKPSLSAPEEETKPKEWRQKIESWLQANENDQVTEEQRKARRTTNRRSFEMDSGKQIKNTSKKVVLRLQCFVESERSSTLDTLPEGKQVYSGSQSNYRKSTWNPSSTIESTDVVSAMEAVEGRRSNLKHCFFFCPKYTSFKLNIDCFPSFLDVQPQIKDKSAWRKSTLNVANSTEATKEDDYRGRHTLPRTHKTDNSLHSIDENKVTDRKELITALGERPPTDKLTLYIRKPNESTNGDKKSNLGKFSLAKIIISISSKFHYLRSYISSYEGLPTKYRLSGKSQYG